MPEVEPSHEPGRTKRISDEQRQLGARVRAARVAAGLTQVRFAHLLGITTRSLQNYESGAITPYRHVHRMAQLTGRSASWILMGGDDAQHPGLGELENVLERQARLVARQLELVETNAAHLRELRLRRLRSVATPRHADRG